MRRLPPHLAPLGYSPRRYLPLSPAPVLGMGERLTDLRDLLLLFANGEQGGYWPADPQYAYEDSSGTTAASANGVVGYRTDVALGKHAVQATTANKPYLRRTPTTNKYWYDSNTETGALTATFSGALGSACTIATVTPDGVSILESQTVGSTYNIAPPYGYNSDVLIIDRVLTAAEKALVTRVMQRSVPTLGSELVTNGGFDDGTTGWVPNAYYPYLDFSIVDGVAIVTSDITKGAIIQILLGGNISGRQFYGKGLFKLVSGFSASFYYSNDISQNKSPAIASYSVGVPVQTCLATQSTEQSSGLAVSISCDPSGVVSVDNVSFKEIL